MEGGVVDVYIGKRRDGEHDEKKGADPGNHAEEVVSEGAFAEFGVGEAGQRREATNEMA